MANVPLLLQSPLHITQQQQCSTPDAARAEYCTTKDTRYYITSMRFCRLLIATDRQLHVNRFHNPPVLSLNKAPVHQKSSLPVYGEITVIFSHPGNGSGLGFTVPECIEGKSMRRTRQQSIFHGIAHWMGFTGTEH